MDKEKSIYTPEEQALIDGVECILDYSEVLDEEDYQEYLRLIERGRQAEAPIECSRLFYKEAYEILSENKAKVKIVASVLRNTDELYAEEIESLLG